MPKLSLSNLANLTNDNTVINTINVNNDLIEAALENTLSRNGSSPNQMLADLDLNNHTIINAPAFVSTITTNVLNNLQSLPTVQPTDGQRIILTPEQFGSLGTYETDGAAFTALSTYIANAGGVGFTIDFMPGKTYRVWDTARVTNVGGQNFLFTFGFLPTKSLRVRTNGCIFESNYDWQSNMLSGTSTFLFHFTDAVDLDIDGIIFTHTVAQTETFFTAGLHLLTFGGACRGVHVGPIRQVGGAGCIFIDKGATFNNANRAQGFVFDYIDLKDVYYGLNPQRNGDYVKATIKAENPGRIFFPISVSNYDIDLQLNETRITSQTAQNCYMVVACEPGGENKMLNMRVRFGGTHKGGTAVQLQINQDTGTPTAGKMHNVHIEFTNLGSASGAAAQIIGFDKNDNTTYGHSVENITFSGVLQNLGAGVNLGGMFNNTNWTGEFISNVIFRDFYVSGSSGPLTIDGRGFTRNLIFQNVDAPFQVISLLNFPTAIIDMSKSVEFSNHKSSGSNSFVEYERLPKGRLRYYGSINAGAGVGLTNVNLPTAFANTGSMKITGLTQDTSGLAAGNILSATVIDADTIQLSRSVGTNSQTLYYEVIGEMGSTGMPIS